MYNIIWVGPQGLEVVDTADSKKEAAYLAKQYREAYDTGFVRYAIQIPKREQDNA